MYIQIQKLLWLASASRYSFPSEICLKVFFLVFVILEHSPSITVSSPKRYTDLARLLHIHNHRSDLLSVSSSWFR